MEERELKMSLWFRSWEQWAVLSLTGEEVGREKTCFKCTGLRKILAWIPPEAHLGIRGSMLRFQCVSQSLCVFGNSTSSVVVLGSEA